MGRASLGFGVLLLGLLTLHSCEAKAEAMEPIRFNWTGCTPVCLFSVRLFSTGVRPIVVADAAPPITISLPAGQPYKARICLLENNWPVMASCQYLLRPDPAHLGAPAQ
jgi:hypothetical protein